MRWLFIAVLLILIGCVLSIVWMNDPGQWPQGDSRLDAPDPSHANLLRGAPSPRNP
jgi:hypothetical protein